MPFASVAGFVCLQAAALEFVLLPHFTAAQAEAVALAICKRPQDAFPEVQAAFRAWKAGRERTE